ncbi:MAG: tRNA pseudouridine(38-40) synthase TruA [Planctomycetota bacterium]
MTLLRNIALVISYNGEKFYGWQKQDKVPTVQQVLENAIEKVTQEKVNLIGASRTDRGVHALAQVANFFTNSSIPAKNFSRAIAQYLPDSIVIKNIVEVAPDFNSRFCAKKKTYMYIVDNSDLPEPIFRSKVFFFPYSLDVEKIIQTREIFIGTKDFEALSNASHSEIENTIRTVYDIKICKKESFLIFYITADGFLYRMARNIVGTLLDAGRNKKTKEEIKEGLEKKDRNRLGFCAPAHALYLYSIEY